MKQITCLGSVHLLTKLIVKAVCLLSQGHKDHGTVWPTWYRV